MQSQQQSASSAQASGSFSSPTGHPRVGVLDGYLATPGLASQGRYDELLGTATSQQVTQIQPLWSQFREQIDQLGKEGFSRRWERSQRLIYENGISYSPYGDPEASGRLWQLDPLPTLIEEQEWQAVAAGIAQRGELLQLVLADLFGEQCLLKEKVLPPELILGHPHFQLPYANLQPAGDSFLHFYAADLGRAPDGKWWLLADRSESPSGVGFALENRVVVSRMLPDIFRASRVKRLAPYFVSVRNRLQQIAQTNRDNPRIALLSRGPDYENYFEDAYLARYLGYTLVEGADLAVRDHSVWLKTLDGLQPVDVLLRRPNSEACDPLEFSGNLSLGPSGLIQAAQHGNVSISNPLGSGLVESPAFMAFMPRLCKFFFQRDLQLPGIATWWCGEAKSLDYTLANLDTLTISHAFRRRGRRGETNDQLAQLTRQELTERLRTNPTSYVAQEQFNSSSVPTYRNGTTSASQLVLRCFAVAQEGSYAVMDGGLARTSPLPAEQNAPKRRPLIPKGDGSKDAWIISKQPVEPISLLSASEEQVSLRRSGTDLPSRVADNISWLGRHLERADATARLLRTFIHRVTSETADGKLVELPALLRAMAEQGQIEAGYALEEIKPRLPELETVLPRWVFDSEQAGTLRSVLDQLFHVASLVRDRLSVDTWRIIVRIDKSFRAPKELVSLDLTDVLGMVNRLIVDLAAIEGLVMESMTRSHVFRFLDLGRRLERSLQTLTLLRSCYLETKTISPEIFEVSLEIADSLMTYRSRYLASLQLSAVLDLLITDETNPRSVAFQLITLQSHIEQLPRDDDQPGLAPYLRLISEMTHTIKVANIQDVSDRFRIGDSEALEQLLMEFETKLPQLANEIWRRYLVHAGTPRKLSATSLDPQS
ncbi:MAG: circularly permuted type 2 ATP-grasp protein [Lacipirellulaceae bacterium]